VIAIGNSGDPALAGEAERLLSDASPLVRGAAVWALGRLAPLRLAELHRTQPADADAGRAVEGMGGGARATKRRKPGQRALWRTCSASVSATARAA